MRIGKHPNGTSRITTTEKLVMGWTKEGFQVFCENCNRSVLDIDFKGQKMAYYQPKPKAGKMPVAKQQ